MNLNFDSVNQLEETFLSIENLRYCYERVIDILYHCIGREVLQITLQPAFTTNCFQYTFQYS